jgi:hypothetical protein
VRIEGEKASFLHISKVREACANLSRHTVHRRIAGTREARVEAVIDEETRRLMGEGVG